MVKKKKIKFWIKRYLPAEVFCTITAMLGAFIVHAYTKNDILTAIAGTWGENIGFYAVHVVREIKNKKVSKEKYSIFFILNVLKNIILEFGPAEVIDSFLVRPFMMYIFPKITGNIYSGILVGKIAADLIIYIPIIISFELQQIKKKDK